MTCQDEKRINRSKRHMTKSSSSDSDPDQSARLKQVAVSWNASGFSSAQVGRIRYTGTALITQELTVWYESKPGAQGPVPLKPTVRHSNGNQDSDYQPKLPEKAAQQVSMCC